MREMSLNEESEYKRKHEPKKNASNKVHRELLVTTESNPKSAQVIKVVNEDESDCIVKEEKQPPQYNVFFYHRKVICSYTSSMSYLLAS